MSSFDCQLDCQKQENIHIQKEIGKCEVLDLSKIKGKFANVYRGFGDPRMLAPLT